MAQKPMPINALEIELEAKEQRLSEIQGNKRIDSDTKLPIAWYQIDYPVVGNTPEEMAEFYLKANAVELGLRYADLSDLRHHATRTTNAGSVVRYRQYHGDYPVNKAELTVSIDPFNTVQYVMSSYEPSVKIATVVASVTAEDAIAAAYTYLGVAGNITYEKNHLMVYKNKDGARLAHEVAVLARTPGGEWHVFVDAVTKEIFKAVDMSYYCSDACKHGHYHNHKPQKNDPPKVSLAVRPPLFLDGSGMVLDPDPLSSNMVAYGGNYLYNNDATNIDLDNARFNVALLDIENNAGVYKLKGPHAEIVDFDTPNTGLFTQASSTFNFNREEAGFEAVNCYYHIDFMMRYINVTLGCNILPYQYAGGVQFDPHGWSGQDQSSFSSGTGQLRFGEGCVDDGEDSDVIHHELGHALHDWATAGGLSQTDGLSEGCGDYVAQSYNRSKGYWAPSDPQYNWVFNWDGHNECWNGRVTNHNVGYPGGLSGSIHTDGQIWASCLMKIWDLIGQEETDKIFYEGLGMTNGSSSQNDAANAVYQAAINLNYTTAQSAAIHAEFTNCGYTLPPLPSDPDDGGIAAVIAPKGSLCSGTFTPIVTLQNYGSNDLTSIDITYDVDGGTPVTFNWTGTLASSSMVDVTLNSMTVTDGAHSFNVVTSMPNGNADSNTTNDNETEAFTTISGGASLTLTLITDTYAFETAWTLEEDAGGTTIESNPPGYENSTTYTHSWCLAEGCYTFVITDSANDGICCQFGNGSFSIINDDDATIYINSNGQYGASETVNICIEPPACTSDETYTGTIASATYATSNTITSDGTVDGTSNVTFQSDCIALNDPFEVQAGGEFLAEIVPCFSTILTNTSTTRSSVKREINYELNPFSKHLTIQYKLKAAGWHNLYLQNKDGKIVDFLINKKEVLRAGKRELVYDTVPVASGLYFLVLETANEKRVEEIVL